MNDLVDLVLLTNYCEFLNRERTDGVGADCCELTRLSMLLSKSAKPVTTSLLESFFHHRGLLALASLPDKQIIGYAMATMSYEPSQVSASLKELAVSPRYRGRKIATNLVWLIIFEVANRRAAETNVEFRTDQSSICRFFDSLLFERVKVNKRRFLSIWTAQMVNKQSKQLTLM